MTHGGLFGSSEAAYCGVPVVATPFYGDQFLNSAAMENRGMGVVLKYKDINRDSVFLSLRKALDPQMKKNAKKVSYSYTHRPMKPKEAAVYWSEYVIATKGAHLARPHTVDAHWLVYSVLDIYLFLLATLIGCVWGLVIFYRKMFAKKKVEEPKKIFSYRAASMERKIK
jgi:glucuronosyltransferase